MAASSSSTDTNFIVHDLFLYTLKQIRSVGNSNPLVNLIYETIFDFRQGFLSYKMFPKILYWFLSEDVETSDTMKVSTDL